jgi:predicted secreted protein
MPVQTPLAVAIFFTMWWIVLLAVLPFGVRAPHEDDEVPPPGCDPGAPTAPKLKQKALITTAVTAVLFVAFMAALKLWS